MNINEQVSRMRAMMGISENSGRYQFAKDIQDDPDYIQFKKDAEYKDDTGQTLSFGTPRADGNDHYVDRVKYSRVKGDEDLGYGFDVDDDIDEANDLAGARDEHYRNMDDWHRVKSKHADDLFREMFNYLLSLDMDKREAWELIHTSEYQDELKAKMGDWLKQNPEPTFDYKSGETIGGDLLHNILLEGISDAISDWALFKYIPKEVNYMITHEGLSKGEAIANHIINGGNIMVYDIYDEDDELGEANMDKVLEAINHVKGTQSELYETLVTESYSEYDCNQFFQIVVTGEITFG